jgi:hypothetical protein
MSTVVRLPATVPTLTTLPPFPDIPQNIESLSDASKAAFVLSLVDHKLTTYPGASGRALRCGWHTGTGISATYPLREDQIKVLAEHYDHNNLAGSQGVSVSVLRKYSPSFKVYFYIDSGLRPVGGGNDVANVDSQNINWILANRPAWLLRDSSGQPIRSAEGSLSVPGEYWPDPGNSGFQAFFASKLQKAIAATGQAWDGVLIDQFFGATRNYVEYAGTAPQTKYTTDTAFQTAQIAFLKKVASVIALPIVANLDGHAALTYPTFFVNVAKNGGGVETEILPFENSDEGEQSILGVEQQRTLITAIQQVPKTKHVRINSKPGGLAGNVDRTLYAYYIYLLVAGKDREVYWTFKEGDSSIPHYWFKEFDLDLGSHLNEANTSGTMWTREFERATLVVNPQRTAQSFPFSGTRVNILGQTVGGPVTVPRVTGMLLFKSPAAYQAAIAPLG